MKFITIFKIFGLLLLMQAYDVNSLLTGLLQGLLQGLLGPQNNKGCSAPSTCQLANYAAANSNKTTIYAQTSSGIPLPSLVASQALGKRGPILLEDYFLLEKLQSFNRERIPERVVHAKGAAAFGYFNVNYDITKYTKADFLQPGKRTGVVVRFSTVGGERGSADTAIDPKGFATKFYTNDGIYDLVGNNIEVFPIRDPMLFPDLNRSRKRNPQTHLADATSWWDMASLRPEMTLHTLHLFSDMGTPKSLRYIDGAGVHTFKMVNAKGTIVFVKFHWTSNQKNKEYFTPDESTKMAGTNPDYLTEDLFNSIERREYPSWDLSIQVMSMQQAAVHPQNPFDVTKFWNRKDYPLIPVGTMTLDGNPRDYYSQVEQLAFSPSHMVPGIEPSPDRMLHARMFAYPDAQLYRLGPNVAQIPVNSCPFQVNTYHRDGLMNVGMNGGGAPNYYPNSFNGLNPVPNDYAKQSVFVVSDNVVDRLDTGDDDNFSLPKLYLKEYVKYDEQLRICSNMASFLRKADKIVQNNYLNNIAINISKEFRDNLEKALLLN